MVATHDKPTPDAARLDALLREADKAIQEMRDEDVNGWPNTMADLAIAFRAALARESEGREDTEREDS